MEINEEEKVSSREKNKVVRDAVVVQDVARDERVMSDTIGKKQSNKGRGISVKIVIIFIISIILSALLGGAGLLIFFKYNPDYLRSTVMNVTKTEKEVTVNENGIADAVEKVYNSVVVVKNYQKGQLYGTGTGFFYKQDDDTYYLLTNHHVISGASTIQIVLTSGDELEVDLVGSDQYADIAVLSLKTDKDIQLIETGDYSAMRVGDTVFAIGAPLDSDVFSWSVTRGILSGKDRQIQDNDWITRVLQTDTAINSGNSGGPLCNSNGQVIGINNMKLAMTGVEGMGFAIPIDDAIEYAELIMKNGKIIRPYMGISMNNAQNSYYANFFNYDSDIQGVLLSSVESGSPAEKADLRVGDIIIGVDDEEITNVASFRYALYKYSAGDKITVKYIRNGKEHTTSVSLVEAK